jgi:hypothetical protein
MKKISYIVFIVFSVMSFYSCKETPKVKFESTGKINQLLLVMDDKDWKGALGDTVREYFAADVAVLPQREPLFSINQIPLQVFDGNFYILRNILIIRKGDSTGVKVYRDKYAKPQIIVEITGKTNKEIASLIRKNAPEIIKLFQENDRMVLQHRNKKKDLVDDRAIRKQLGITIQIPNSYKLIVNKDGFFWYREDLPFGSKNILLYSVPLAPLDSIADHIPEIRDSIGKKYIPGPLPNTWMVTEKGFSPVQRRVKLNGIESIESRGLWEIENDFMGGPYLNYIIPVPGKGKAVIAEGFIYLPSDEKRNLLTELESILRTAKPVE